MDGWDALQLLSLFRVARMVDIPHEGPRMLAQLPLAQVCTCICKHTPMHVHSSLSHKCGQHLAPPHLTLPYLT